MPRDEERITVDWSGNTSGDRETIDTAHRIVLGGAESTMTAGAGPAFAEVGGLADSGLPDPERLLGAAASSCLLLSFLGIATRARLEVVEYHDEVVVTFEEERPPLRLARLDLRPIITVRGESGEYRLRRLVDLAHRDCTIAATLATPLHVEPTFVLLD